MSNKRRRKKQKQPKNRYQNDISGKRVVRLMEGKRKTRENGLTLSHTRLRGAENEWKIPPPRRQRERKVSFSPPLPTLSTKREDNVEPTKFSRRVVDQRLRKWWSLNPFTYLLISEVDPLQLGRKDICLRVLARSDSGDCGGGGALGDFSTAGYATSSCFTKGKIDISYISERTVVFQRSRFSRTHVTLCWHGVVRLPFPPLAYRHLTQWEVSRYRRLKLGFGDLMWILQIIWSGSPASPRPNP